MQRAVRHRAETEVSSLVQYAINNVQKLPISPLEQYATKGHGLFNILGITQFF